MKYKLACFDLDGTIIENVEFIWQVIHDHLPTDKKKRALGKKMFIDGKISYEEWARYDVTLWKEAGATRKELELAISDIHLVKGARETLRELKKRGMKLALISGSIDFALKKALPEYKEIFDYVFINRLVFKKDGKILYIKPTPFDFSHKAKALDLILKGEKIPAKKAIFIGDHDNDVEIAKKAGFAIAFNCKSEKLKKVADVVIKEKDLRRILDYI